MKKKPVIIALSVVALIAVIYSGSWFYLKNVVWKSHLPADISNFTIEKTANRTYYRSQPDEKYYIYTMSEPSFFNFPWYCTFNVTGSLGTDDDLVVIQDNQQPQYVLYPMSGSDFDYSFVGHLGIDGRIHDFACNINSYSSDDQYPKSAFFLLNSDLTVQNAENLTEQERNLHSKTLPEIQELRDNLFQIFSLQ